MPLRDALRLLRAALGRPGRRSGHWQIENGLHWMLDVVFADDHSRLREGHGARSMAVVRHFAFNLQRAAPEPQRPERSPLKRRPAPGAPPRRISLKLRRKIASWARDYTHRVPRR